MAETVRWNDIKWKIWFEQKKERAKAGVKNVGKAIWNHPVETLAVLGVVGGVAKKGANIISNHQEDMRRKRDFWDPRTGRHTICRRTPNSREEQEIDRRYNSGESYVSILSDMRLTK